MIISIIFLGIFCTYPNDIGKFLNPNQRAQPKFFQHLQVIQSCLLRQLLLHHQNHDPNQSLSTTFPTKPAMAAISCQEFDKINSSQYTRRVAVRAINPLYGCECSLSKLVFSTLFKNFGPSTRFSLTQALQTHQALKKVKYFLSSLPSSRAYSALSRPQKPLTKRMKHITKSSALKYVHETISLANNPACKNLSYIDFLDPLPPWTWRRLDLVSSESSTGSMLYDGYAALFVVLHSTTNGCFQVMQHVSIDSRCDVFRFCSNGSFGLNLDNMEWLQNK